MYLLHITKEIELSRHRENFLMASSFRVFDGHMHVRGVFLPKEGEGQVRMPLVKYLDHYGIAKAVVTTLNEEVSLKSIAALLMNFSSVNSPDPADLINQLAEASGNSRATMQNVAMDHEPVRRLVEEYPDRFVGAYWFNPVDPDQEAAFRALEVAIDDWGFRMVKIHSAIHYGRVPEDIERLGEFCASRSVPLFIHLCPAVFSFRGVRPFDVITLAQQYRKLKIILGHFAYAMEACVESCVAATLRTNVYLDTSLAIPYGLFTGYKVVGYKRLLFGSDSPVAGPPDGEMNTVHLLQIPDKEKQAIFYDNMARLLGVED